MSQELKSIDDLENEEIEEIDIEEEPETEFSGENQEILSNNVNYEEFFQQLFLDIYDIESGFEKACDGFTSMLLRRGLEVDPQQVYSNVEMILGRMIKVTIVKRLCAAFSLHEDEILEKELSIHYGISAPRSKPKPPHRAYGEV